MLTPNAVKEVRKTVLAPKKPGDYIIKAEHLVQAQMVELYELVLNEIADGSIDPKSLALAALGKEV